MPVPGRLKLFEWYSLNLRLGRLLILFGKGLPQANRYSRLAPVASRIFLLSAYRCRSVRRMRNFQLSCDARNGTLQGGLMLIVCFTRLRRRYRSFVLLDQSTRRRHLEFAVSVMTARCGRPTRARAHEKIQKAATVSRGGFLDRGGQLREIC